MSAVTFVTLASAAVHLQPDKSDLGILPIADLQSTHLRPSALTYCVAVHLVVHCPLGTYPDLQTSDAPHDLSTLKWVSFAQVQSSPFVVLISLVPHATHFPPANFSASLHGTQASSMTNKAFESSHFLEQSFLG